jgi:hypothetical protein
MQAAEHHLASGPASPLALFSPAFVGTMTSEQLEQDDRERCRREQLLKGMENLEKGQKILI